MGKKEETRSDNKKKARASVNCQHNEHKPVDVNILIICGVKCDIMTSFKCYARKIKKKAQESFTTNHRQMREYKTITIIIIILVCRPFQYKKKNNNNI